MCKTAIVFRLLVSENHRMRKRELIGKPDLLIKAALKMVVSQSRGTPI